MLVRNRDYPVRSWAFALVCLVLAACAAPGDPKRSGDAQRALEPPATEVEVFFATNRAPAADAQGPFGAQRGDLTVGIARVGIPPGHRIGRHEKPSVFRFEWSPDERKHIQLRGSEPLRLEEFYERLAEAIARSPNRAVMIFVHGYNTEFAQAAQLMAQLTTDLKFPGPALLFSWPSKGTFTGYTVDATNAEWSQQFLTQVLADLLDQGDAEHVYLVAHSMGARIVTRAYNALAALRGAETLRAIREMILVAPDIDADVFRRDIAPELARNGIPVTLYASSADRALLASKAFHGYPRAGDSGKGLVLVPGVETVDASGASGGLFGHSYFAEDRRIMEDIFAILQTGRRADARFGLRAVDVPDGRYWTFRE